MSVKKLKIKDGVWGCGAAVVVVVLLVAVVVVVVGVGVGVGGCGQSSSYDHQTFEDDRHDEKHIEKTRLRCVGNPVNI